MQERIAIIEGLRTPMGKAGTSLKDIPAEVLGTHAVRELISRMPINKDEVDEVIMGNVAQPANAANIARVIALRAGLAESMPAFTVHRNCASGMQAITSASAQILSGESKIVIAGGTESMSNIPLLFGKRMTSWFEQLNRAKSLGERLAVFTKFRMRYLKPVIGVMEGLTDPVCGLIMGLTAEKLAKEFKITREEQDRYALQSHERALAAQEKGILAEEIVPISSIDYRERIEHDVGPRKGQSLDKLGKLKPYFDRSSNGTVTVGNACPITDGAAATLLMSESEAKNRGLKPLGFLRSYAYAGLDPSRMGLGPAFATAKLLKRDKVLSMSDFQLVELNEAFAAQVIANIRAFGSKDFAEKELGQSQALGELDESILNVNGGAIALGHPVGTTGTRIVIHTLKELRRRGQQLGLATLCVGGGQGAALALEVE